MYYNPLFVFLILNILQNLKSAKAIYCICFQLLKNINMEETCKLYTGLEPTNVVCFLVNLNKN